MVFKFKLTSVIFVVILAVIIALSVFALTRPNRDLMVTTVIFAAAIFAAAAVITFLFARSVARQITGAADTLKSLSEDEFDPVRRISGNSEDDADAFGGTVADMQSATKTLVKNNVSVKGLIESYETDLCGMQGVITELREIVNSLDILLLKCKVTDSGVQEETVHRNA